MSNPKKYIRVNGVMKLNPEYNKGTKTVADESNNATRVQLSLYAQTLKNVAGMGKGISDPYAVVTLVASNPAEKPRILGQTEVIKNTLSPRWTTTFLIDYEFGKPTRVNVGIYDEVKKAKNNKPMGSAVFEIGDLLGSRGNIKAKKLKHGGTVFARVEKAPEQDMGTLTFALQGIKLKNVDGFLSKSDPFFEVSRRINAAGGTTWHPVYRSEHIMNNLNPKWETASISLAKICEGDQTKPILITVYDWEKSGKHNSMGSFETTVNGLLGAKTNPGTGNMKSIDTSNAFRLMRNGKLYGNIVVTVAAISGGASTSAPVPASGPFSKASDGPPPTTQKQSTISSIPPPIPVPIPAPIAPTATFVNSEERPKFVDYITGGCELSMCVAVDFTGSNGDPRRPGTLHYIHKDGQLNDYEKALTAVGSIVAKYDSDQKFPVWGFGAKFRGVINHCFQLGPNAEADGLSGVLAAYRSTFKTGLTMSGPTLFAEVINLAAAQARSRQATAKRIGQQAYSILLILTDGAVSDMPGTKQAIQAASDAPLSIVIVGIGEADFSAMQALDDFQSATGGGRDICQFVEFSRHKSNRLSLTQATLDEIPDQLVDYFYGNGINPLPPITGSKVDIMADAYDEDVDIDLSLDINEEGEICLAENNDGAVYDETSYGNFAMYAGLQAIPPPTNPSMIPPPAPYQPAGAPSMVSHQQSGGAYVQAPAPRAQPTAPVAPVMASPVFHVQVPPGISAGMQLQVKNPSTGQPMIVTVPNGIAPGGTFPVAY